MSAQHTSTYAHTHTHTTAADIACENTKKRHSHAKKRRHNGIAHKYQDAVALGYVHITAQLVKYERRCARASALPKWVFLFALAL